MLALAEISFLFSGTYKINNNHKMTTVLILLLIFSRQIFILELHDIKEAL